MMHRFFVEPELIARMNSGLLALEGAIAHQVANVLRLRVGDEITLLDNAGSEYLVWLERVERKLVVVQMVETKAVEGEPQTQITLYQSLLKGEKWDFVLQKCTEVGVSRIVPVVSERCVARPAGGRQHRHLRIIQEAAEQSQRGLLPLLGDTLTFAAACEQAVASHDLALILWEGEPVADLGHALRQQYGSVALFVGPEGGYSAQEVTLAHQYGIIPATLGPRILRAETAGLVAAAITLYSFGDMQK
ncbi:MAG: 16S rRNA (uracil(1498)-N(3))-methyltransferase, partial [Candidatus Chloroheliales bacterium]